MLSRSLSDCQSLILNTMIQVSVSVSEECYWSSFKWWRTDGSWDQRWMVEHPRFKHEKVTMVIKIIIGIMICRDCIASGQNSIMISSQMSDFRHLWHAHPQRWACHRCPEKWQYRTSVAWFSCHRCPCHRCGASMMSTTCHQNCQEDRAGRTHCTSVQALAGRQGPALKTYITNKKSTITI